MYAYSLFRLGYRRFTPLLSLSIIGEHFEHDVDLIGKITPGAPKTGWERVKKMYSVNEQEDISLEMTYVLQSAMTGIFLGACIGGIVSSKTAYISFVENNQASIFKSTADAKKKLQDYVTVAFAKGAVRWGWRLGIFSGIFSLVATTIAVYRGNTSVVEYVSAGAMAGGLYKLHMGPVGTLVGAGLGAVLGGIVGTMIISILKLTGISMDDIRRVFTKLSEHRVDQYNQALDKQSVIKTDPLTVHHENLVKEKGQKTLADVQ